MTQDATMNPGPHHEPPTSTAIHFCLLGEFAITLHGERISPPPHRTRGLLAALLLRPYPQRRERLVGLLSPDIPERKGRQQLSHLLWLLRRSLPDLPLETSTQEVYLPPETRWLDVEAFRQAAARDDLGSWLEAMALYRGDLLEGVYDDWLLEEREALYLQHARLSHRACDKLLQQRQYREALPLAERLVQKEPYDERALRGLMKAYQAMGRRGMALAAYERFVAQAAGELGVEPEPSTRALAQAIYATGAHMHASLSPKRSGGGSPEALLRRARNALGQGDWTGVEETLQLLHADPGCCEGDVLLLKIDLALQFQEYTRAEHLLEACDLEKPAERVRAAQLALGQHDARMALETASEALMMAHEAADRETELQALLVLANAQQQIGQSLQAMRSAEQALVLARRSGSAQGITLALTSEGFGQLRQGRYARALVPLHEARLVAAAHGLRYHLAVALHGIRLAQSHTNALGDALVTVQEELSIWRDLGLAHWEAAALEGLAIIQNHLGDSADSLRTLEQAQEISRRLGEPVRMAISQYNLACGLVYHDDALATRTIDKAREALGVFRANNQPGWEAATLTILGYAQWLAGQNGAALDVFRQAYETSERAGEWGRLPELLAYQGLAHLGLDHPPEALGLTRRAVLALAQGEVSEEVVPEIYYAHAVALSANDMEEQAAGYFAQAYEHLLAGAAELEDEAARQAFFHRNPTMRRLMRELRARGIVPAQERGVFWHTLPAARGGPPVQVRWTVDAGPADAALQQVRGTVSLRRARLSRLLREAAAQGAAPTAADLAKALGVSKRTAQRDLAALRHAQ
jgi:DNA-binding SARP family transcriptional activator